MTPPMLRTIAVVFPLGALFACMAAPPPASSVPNAVASVPSSASATPASRYEVSQLVSLELDPVDIAINDSHVFVAESNIGARITSVRSRVVAAPLTGGRADTVPGSETQPGTGVLGVAFFGMPHVSVSSSDAAPAGVYRVASGQLTLIAGGNRPSGGASNGDGGPAQGGVLHDPRDIAFSRQGDLYIADQADSRVRVVVGGSIRTYAGDGTCRHAEPQPGPVTATAICRPGVLAVDLRGVLYVAQRSGATWIARIDQTGALTKLAAPFPIAAMTVDATGDVVVVDANTGTIVRITGAASAASVVAANLGTVRGITAGSDGTLYLLRGTGNSSSSVHAWEVAQIRRS